MRLLEELEWNNVSGGVNDQGGDITQISGDSGSAIFGIVMANVNDFTSLELADTANGIFVTAGGLVGDIRKAFLASGYRVSDGDIMRGKENDPDWLASMKIK